MATLTPDHPYPWPPVGDPKGVGDPHPRQGRVAYRRRGRRRSHSRWILYRPLHRIGGRAGFVRLLPCWRYGPVRSTPDTPGTPRTENVTPEAHAPADIELRGTETGAAPPVAPGENPLAAPSTPAAAATHSALGPSRRPVVAGVAGSLLLPVARPGDGSSLAAVLGFGESEVSFGDDRGEGKDPDPADSDPWDDLLPLSAVAADLDRRGNTGDAVKLLWDASADLEMDRDLLPGNDPTLEASLRSRRRVSWSLVAGLVTLTALIGITAKLVSDLPEREAEVREAEYVTAARELAGALAPIEQSLGAGGLLSDSGLSTLTGHLQTFDGAARTAALVASEQLPRPLIIGSSLPIEQLAVPQRLLESASTRALEVGQRIGDAVTYSHTLSLAFDIPTLPDEASLDEVDGIAQQLSLSIAETRHSVADLPHSPFFESVQQAAIRTADVIEESQADYVSALRNGDAGRASGASTDMDVSIAELRQDLRAPLQQIQTWALGEIAELRVAVTEIESVIAG